MAHDALHAYFYVIVCTAVRDSGERQVRQMKHHPTEADTSDCPCCQSDRAAV